MTVDVSKRKAALFTLRRHYLLEAAPRDQVQSVLAQVLGLNAQGALNVQLSLWNRVPDIDTGLLPEALHAKRSLVKTWLMRNTVHVIPSDELPLYRSALTDSLLREWNRSTVRSGAKESSNSWEVFYPGVLEALAHDALTVRQIQEALEWSDRGSSPLLNRLIREMSLHGLLCHAESLGPWYHTTGYRFARVDKWLPRIPSGSVSKEEALARLARKYLKAYGPASVQDFAHWAGLRVNDSKAAFDTLSDSLEELTIRMQQGKVTILKEDLSELLDIREPNPVHARLLPAFDALIMGHKDKSRFVKKDAMSKVFLPLADVAATIMLDGEVQGVWTIRKAKKIWKMELSPFKKFSEEETESVEREVERMKGFTGLDAETIWKSFHHITTA